MSRKLQSEDFKIPLYHADTFLTKHDDLPILPMKRVDSIEYDSKMTQFVPKDGLEPVSLSVVRQKSGQLQPTKEAQIEKARFLQAIKDFKQASGISTNVDLSQCTWRDLIQHVEVLSKQYRDVDDGSPEGFRGKIRKGFRNLAKYQQGVNSMLEFLPGDAWQASLIVGSIRLIFDAAGRLQKMREETYEMIEQIPQTLDKAERLFSIYDDSNKLRQLVSNLYIGVLQGLVAILNWYKVKSLKKVLKTAISRDSGAEEIQESLEQLRKLEKEIDEEVNIKGHEKLDQVQHALQSTESSSKLGAAYGNEILEFLRNDERVFKNFVMAQLMVLSSREVAIQEREKAEEERIRALQQQNQKLLFAAMRYDHRTLLSDRQVVLRNGLTFAEEERGRASFFFKSRLFVTWLSCKSSAVLILNAHCNDHEGQGVSPASLLCAMLASSIEKIGDTVLMVWFCGNHLPRDSPRLMISNLIGQLLASGSCKVNLSTISPQAIATIGQQMAPDMLVWLLTLVIRQQLETSPVTLLLDGLSFYEAQQHLDCTSQMIRALTELTQEKSKHPLKILITSPTQITRLSSAIVNAGQIHFVNGEETDLMPVSYFESLVHAQTPRSQPNQSD